MFKESNDDEHACCHGDTDITTMFEEDVIMEVADVFKVLSDSTRLRILLALEKEELCVCKISSNLGMSISAISHQLKVLRQSRLVKGRRDGKNIYYSLDDDHVKKILGITLEHVME